MGRKPKPASGFVMKQLSSSQPAQSLPPPQNGHSGSPGGGGGGNSTTSSNFGPTLCLREARAMARRSPRIDAPSTPQTPIGGSRLRAHSEDPPSPSGSPQMYSGRRRFETDETTRSGASVLTERRISPSELPELTVRKLDIIGKQLERLQEMFVDLKNRSEKQDKHLDGLSRKLLHDLGEVVAKDREAMVRHLEKARRAAGHNNLYGDAPLGHCPPLPPHMATWPLKDSPGVFLNGDEFRHMKADCGWDASSPTLAEDKIVNGPGAGACMSHRAGDRFFTRSSSLSDYSLCGDESVQTSAVEDSEDDKPRNSPSRGDMHLNDQVDKPTNNRTHATNALEGVPPADHFAQHRVFNGVISAAIVANVIWLGVASEGQLREEFRRLDGKSKGEGLHWIVGDLFFCMLFLAEMVVRIAANWRAFLWGRERYWNYFDSVIVMSSIFESIADLVSSGTGVDVSMLRTLRVLRIVRLLRVGKVFPPIRVFIRHLQCILFSVSGSVEAFLASMIVYFIVLYIFGISFMGGVNTYVSTTDDAYRESEKFASTAGLMRHHYGTMSDTMLTLLASVAGGYDWNETVAPFKEAGWTYHLLFVIYVLLVTVGLLNIFTGIFVNAAMQSSAMNRELAISEAAANRDGVVRQVMELFFEADKTGSGRLSLDDLEQVVQEPNIRAFFTALELDMSSASRVFKLLDRSGDGLLEPTEFVEGCIELRGVAKKVDISLLQKEHTVMLSKLERLERYLLPHVKESTKSHRRVLS
eukprot:TRINITY_DN111205_c0_g1_i1.p1 TRINITY_DN111205_c0_g1~~TRINITY_DN111205_c0_g1_i1.p1  ORF type:complete len:754 (-),score=166.08 TRINITY_DN111205_c0_g1_i1:159-2420(-)